MSLRPADLLPHGDAAVLIESVSSIEDDYLDCVAVIPGASAFASGGTAQPWLAIEICAQAAAVHEALTRGAGHRPVQGVLAQVDDMRFEDVALVVGRPCRVTVRRVSQAMGFAAWDVTLDQAGRAAAAGRITTFVQVAAP